MKNAERVSVQCPYCGVRQVHELTRSVRPQVVLCDIEEVPGCDRYFAVTLTMIPRLSYHLLVDERNGQMTAHQEQGDD